MKPIISILKTELRKEKEEGLLFDVFKKLVLQKAGQNMENMNMMVMTLKESFPKLDPSVSLPPSSSKMTKLTKPAKVPSWSRNMMILSIGAPVSIDGVSWMTQYLKEFNLTIKDMKSMKCNQLFVFGPSRRYLSQTLVELPVLVMRLNGREEVLLIQTYLVDVEVPFLCGKQTLENWNFKIDGRDKILKNRVQG